MTTHATAPATPPQGASAHRGDCAKAPANTLPAIEAAVRKGAGQIEFDVKMSRDKELVIRHNGTVDDTTDGTGDIADMTLAELRRLDAGSWFSAAFRHTPIPTLDEVLERIPHHIGANVHVHDDPETAVRVALRLAQLKRLDHCFLTMGRKADFARAVARAAVPRLALCKGHLGSERVTEETTTISAEILHLCETLFPGHRINPHIDYIQLVGGTVEQVSDGVRALHAQGTRVNYCCTSDREEIRALVATQVDYILTDDLDLCLEVLGANAAPPRA